MNRHDLYHELIVLCTSENDRLRSAQASGYSLLNATKGMHQQVCSFTDLTAHPTMLNYQLNQGGSDPGVALYTWLPPAKYVVVFDKA